MIEDKKIRYGLGLFIIGIILLNLYYYYQVFSGTYEYMDELFSVSILGFLFWLDIILTIILLFSATYGFYHKKKWSRIIITIILLYSSFWAIISMFGMRWQVLEHLGYFAFYIAFIVFFNMSFVIDYLNEYKKIDYFSYKGYILHKKDILTKKGKTRTFYFFALDKSDSGIPCMLPKNYMVMENKKTGVPYIKKIN